jgi:hypothetical protein
VRVANWPVVLAEKIEEWRQRPFAWGTSDCWQMAGEIALALTGEDYRMRFPAYATEEEANAILAAHGGATGLATFALGDPKPVARAQRGDILVADYGMGLGAGICLGVQSCAPGLRGLVFRSTAIAIAAFTV